MLKEFINTQTAFDKSVEEKFGKIDVLASKVDSLALDVDLLKLKVMPDEVKDTKFAKKMPSKFELMIILDCWLNCMLGGIEKKKKNLLKKIM